MRTVGFSPTRAMATVALVLVSSACADESNEVSYKTQIAPLLEQRRCVLCHYEGTKLEVATPFEPENGLFVVENTWYEGHGGLQYNVVPGDPDASFLIQKVTDPELKGCAPGTAECPNSVAGLFMPPSPPPATSAQIEIIRAWISAGAADTPDFRTRVVPIFGDLKFTDSSCSRGGYANFCVPCYTCHNEDAGTTPNLVVPNFADNNVPMEDRNRAVADWLATIVGVKSHFRADLDLVKPGDPDASFLVMKLEAPMPSSAVGAPMPYAIEPLSSANVDLLRRWIREGARNN